MIETINVTGLKQEQIEQLQQMITNFKNKNEEEINYNAWGNPVTRESSQTVIKQIKQLRKTIALDINDSNDKSCYDLAMELGIIGIAKDLPSDLSTNPDYFKGFGEL